MKLVSVYYAVVVSVVWQIAERQPILFRGEFGGYDKSRNRFTFAQFEKILIAHLHHPQMSHLAFVKMTGRIAINANAGGQFQERIAHHF